MAELIINDKSFKINDNTAIVNTCEDGGVPFNCQAGNCGTCMIQIEEGANNLSDLTEREEDMGMDLYNRLACQCVIKSGTVKISV